MNLDNSKAITQIILIFLFLIFAIPNVNFSQTNDSYEIMPFRMKKRSPEKKNREKLEEFRVKNIREDIEKPSKKSFCLSTRYSFA